MQRQQDWRQRVDLRATRVGKGVFALRPFRKGQVVGQMHGTVVADDTCDPRYCVDLGEDCVLDPRAPFRYLNHSCEPNCELVEHDAEPGCPQIWVYALRGIRPAAQLTIDYAWSAAAAIECLCGAPSCRGWIVDADQLATLKRQRRSRSFAL